MARRNSALDALPKVERERLEADIARGELSWAGLSARYKIPAGTLREFAERNGILRNPTGLKRAIVEQAMSMPEPAPATDSANQTARQTASPAESKLTDPARAEIEAAAAEDVRDMRIGLQAARAGLTLTGKKLANGVASPDMYSPKDLKVLSECVAINISTIRLIRGLDAGYGIPDMKDLSIEQLRALAAGKVPR